MYEDGEYRIIQDTVTDTEGTVLHRYTYDYELHNGRVFRILYRFESGNTWQQTEYEYSYVDAYYDYDTVTETRTQKDGTVDWIRTRKIYFMDSGYAPMEILRVYPNATDASVSKKIYDYVVYEDTIVTSYEKTEFANGTWRLYEYEYDFEAGTYVQTYTDSSGNTTTSTETIEGSSGGKK